MPEKLNRKIGKHKTINKKILIFRLLNIKLIIIKTIAHHKTLKMAVL
jgi:hypothetical protein